jgi:hypothetical protein
MRFDQGLQKAVHARAPQGVHFTDAEVRQALQAAVDARDGGNLEAALWLRHNAVGRAAWDALDTYEPRPPVPASWPVVIARAVVIGLVALTASCLLLGLLSLVYGAIGLHLGLRVSWVGAIAVYLVWTGLALLAREPLGLTNPTEPFPKPFRPKAEVQVGRETPSRGRDRTRH